MGGYRSISHSPITGKNHTVLFSLFSRKKKSASPAGQQAPRLTVPEGTRASAAATAPPATIAARAVVAPPAVAPAGSVSARPVAARPAAARPATAQPAAPRPVSARPVSARPVSARPVVAVSAPAVPAPANAASTSGLTVPDLRRLARDLGLTGYSRLPKSELVRVITEHNAK
jgi:hypothetical protein